MLMPADLISDLAPTGALRAGINLSNILLVTRIGPSGDPEGIAADLAREIAMRLCLPIKYIPFKSPGELADQAGRDVWDIALLAAEPQRAETIAFTAPYAEIEATYLVPARSSLNTVEAADAPGVRIAVMERSAYGLWLDRNIKRAELIKSPTFDDACERFVGEGLDVLAGLRPQLVARLKKLAAGGRVIDGRFTAVQQAVGAARKHVAAIAYLSNFVEEAKASGLIARLIERHNVRDLSVAPAAGSSRSG
jgi:polar amino acid transport system substrate-binding protein